MGRISCPEECRRRSWHQEMAGLSPRVNETIILKVEMDGNFI
jgi:hypothetical protein